MSMLKKKNSNHDAGSSFPARRCSSYPVFRQTETPSSPTSSCCPSSSPNGRGVKTSTPAWWSSYIFNLVFDGFSFPLFLTVYCLCFVWLYRCTLFDVTLPPPLSFNVDEDGKPHLHLRSSWTIEAPQPTISTVSMVISGYGCPANSTLYRQALSFKRKKKALINQKTGVYRDPEKPIILLWDGAGESFGWSKSGHPSNNWSRSRIAKLDTPCTFTTDTSLLPNASMVIIDVGINSLLYSGAKNNNRYHSVRLTTEDDLVNGKHCKTAVSFPPVKYRSQLWSALNLEPAGKTVGLQHFSFLFDWQIAMDKRSQIKVGMMCPSWGNPVFRGMSFDYVKQNDAFEAGDNSVLYIHHQPFCYRRPEQEEFLVQLADEYPVVAYGRCVGWRLRHQKVRVSLMKQQDPNFDLNDWNTVLQLMSRHKFVFIVDDSRRAEFISEQVSQALLSGSIPIYWGGFSVKEVLPRKDAIMTMVQFNYSSTQLASWLHLVSTNTDIYNAYFSWKVERIPRPVMARFLQVLDECVFYAEKRICDALIQHLAQKEQRY